MSVSYITDEHIVVSIALIGKVNIPPSPSANLPHCHPTLTPELYKKDGPFS